MLDILFIVKKRIDSYGKSYGLVNSAIFVSNYLNSVDYKSEVIEVIDANQIDREVTLRNPKYVVLEALWVTPEKIKELLSIPRHCVRNWVIRIHSKVPFLANEGNAINWIEQYIKLVPKFPNLFIAPNTLELTTELKNIFCNVSTTENVVLLPNIYFPLTEEIKPYEKYKSDYIDIGCFGAVRPMKNHLQQAIAAIKFGDIKQKTVRFHINGNRVEQQGDSVLRNLISLFDATRHELVMHPWLKHKDFLDLIKTMDFGTQVSLSESYNIVTADFVYNNIPIVVSPDVHWMPRISKANPNSVDSIVFKYGLVYGCLRNIISNYNDICLSVTNTAAEQHWLGFINIPEQL